MGGLANHDPLLVEKTYDNFIPALPLTFTTLMFALLGFVTSFGVLSMGRHCLSRLKENRGIVAACSAAASAPKAGGTISKIHIEI